MKHCYIGLAYYSLHCNNGKIEVLIIQKWAIIANYCYYIVSVSESVLVSNQSYVVYKIYGIIFLTTVCIYLGHNPLCI